MSLDQLRKRFANAATLDFPAHVQPGDFRIRYREMVAANAKRILG